MHLIILSAKCQRFCLSHDDVIKWKHFPRYWPFVRGIHRWPVNSPHKGQLRGALMFSLICTWMNDWVNNHEAGDLRCHRAHYDVTVMASTYFGPYWWQINNGSYTGLGQPENKPMPNLVFAKILTSRGNELTHWGRDKMAAIFQTTVSNAFSWMKLYEFWLKFHWSLSQGVQLTMFHRGLH